MEALAAELGLACPAMPWHGQRDALVELASWLALLTGSLGKLGQDVLLMAQNELGELREAAGGGSSAMPQKSNPVRAEALVALARRNATLVAGMHHAALHALERDGAAWQLEWATLPDMASTAAAALARAGELAATVVVDAGRMRAVLDGTRGLLLAEAAGLALAAHLPRDEAQELVRRACREARASGRDMVEVLAEHTDVAVDWRRLRDEAELPPCADVLVCRVLDAAAGRAR
jgi:3-carboxy-cis,cis-muconate cycloisomerase